MRTLVWVSSGYVGQNIAQLTGGIFVSGNDSASQFRTALDWFQRTDDATLILTAARTTGWRFEGSANMLFDIGFTKNTMLREQAASRIKGRVTHV